MSGLFPTNRALPESSKPALQPEIAFGTLAEARDAIHHIVLEWLHHVPIDQATHHGIIDRFEIWCRAFDTFICLNRHTIVSARDERSLALLELHRRYLRMHVAIYTSNGIQDPLAWDGYSNEFDKMIDYAAVAMQIDESEAASSEQPLFHMDTGTIPILFAIIHRCRHPLIRRRAMSLVLSNPIQEGMWNSCLVGKAGQKLVALEENGGDVRSCEDVPADTRVRRVSMHIGDEERHFIVRFWQLLGCWQEALGF